jgi:hypothetical protein
MAQSDRRAITFVLLAGFVAGLLDIIYALLFHGARGVPHIAVLQSIASALHGPAAFRGGAAAAGEGLALHFLISCAAAAAYFAAAWRLPLLARRPCLFGPVFGLAFWALMNFLVVPLSAARFGPPDSAEVVGGLLAHAFLFGLPIALVARRVFGAPRRALAEPV